MHRIRRLGLKLLVGLAGFLAFTCTAFYFAGLPRVEAGLESFLRESGLSLAVLERGQLGTSLASYRLYPSPGAAPLADVTLDPLGSLLSRRVSVSHARLVLGANWLPAGYIATGQSGPVAKLLETPLEFPALAVEVKQLEVVTPLGLLTGSLSYDGTVLSAKWAYLGQSGDLLVQPAPDKPGAYMLSLTAPAFRLSLAGGQEQPVISLAASAAAYALGAVSASEISLQVNEAQKPGYVLPYKLGATVSGKPLEVSGSLNALQQTATGQLAAELIKLQNMEATRLSGSFELTSLWPPVVKNGARFSALALQAGGLPLIAPQASAGFANNRLKLQSATAGLFGGQVALAPAEIALPLKHAALTANFTDLDLGQVLQLAAVEGLGGDGKLSGSVPVTYDNSHITLGTAQLKATGSGQVHYAPAEPPAFMAAGGQGELLGQVFSDFRYTGITLTLGGTLGDNLTLGARLEGSNPSFYNGHSVAFNLNLSGALESLLTQGLQSFHFSPEAIKQMTQETKP